MHTCCSLDVFNFLVSKHSKPISVHRSWLGKYTDKNTKNYFLIKMQKRLYFLVYCVVFFLPVPIRVCRSIAPQQPMKEWNGRVVSCVTKECSADKAGLPPNYTNLEKNRGQFVFCAHTKLCLVVQLVSCNCLTEKSSHLVVFLGEKVISTCVLPSSEACF